MFQSNYVASRSSSFWHLPSGQWLRECADLLSVQHRANKDKTHKCLQIASKWWGRWRWRRVEWSNSSMENTNHWCILCKRTWQNHQQQTCIFGLGGALIKKNLETLHFQYLLRKAYAQTRVKWELQVFVGQSPSIIGGAKPKVYLTCAMRMAPQSWYNLSASWGFMLQRRDVSLSFFWVTPQGNPRHFFCEILKCMSNMIWSRIPSHLMRCIFWLLGLLTLKGVWVISPLSERATCVTGFLLMFCSNNMLHCKQSSR